MKTTVEHLEPTRAKLTITVTPEELRPSIDKAYKLIAEQIQIPGFRKGKVPPPIIDQRVGRGEVLNQAVTDGLDEFYRAGIKESDVRPLGRPSADVTSWPEPKDFSGDLVIEVEVDVRPEFDMPKLEGRTVEVPAIEVSDDAVEEELTKLRSRFGTLVSVDRPAATGDFVTLDLTATIDDTEVDSASGISYEVGSGQLLDGIDEAVESLTAGEETTFASTLVGGDHAGKEAQVQVSVTAVKERELPEADDEFAQLSSEFDTIEELRENLKSTVEQQAIVGQVGAAREALQAALLEDANIPVPTNAVEDEVHRHLEGENRLEDDEHRAEVKEETEKSLRSGILFDRIAEENNLQVSQTELSQYVFQMASQYGMGPQELVQILQENGQLPQVLSDLLRGKALTWALSKVDVVDDKGEKVDVSDFTAAVVEPELSESDVETAIHEAEAAAAEDEATDGDKQS